MNTAIAGLLVMCILPLVCAWIGGYFRHRQLGHVDNKEPRIQAQQLTGAGARAIAAQANTWEALAVYSAAILAVYIAGVDLDTLATPVMVFVALRIAYIAAYIGNKDTPRSLIFLAGYAICMYFFYLALSTG